MPKKVIINVKIEDFEEEEKEEAKIYAGKYVFQRLTAGKIAIITDECSIYNRRGLQSRELLGKKKNLQLRESMIESPCEGDKLQFIENMPDWLFYKLYIMGFSLTIRGITKEEEIFLERLPLTE
jgi:hypothetical protein